MVSGGEGSSNLLYLPIDKLMQQGGSGATASSSSSSSAVPSAGSSATRLPAQLQQRDLRSRETR